MKIMKNVPAALLAALLFAAGTQTLCAQSAQPASDPAKSDSSSAKKSEQPKKTGAAAQESATAPASPAAPAASTPANSASTSTPASKPATAQLTTPRNTGETVWVNTETGVYHKAGSHWYGKTKHGKYMTEADARKAGYREAKKNQ
jgi:hypothetical protein